MLFLKKEYLNKSEYDFCVKQDPSFKSDLFYIGDYSAFGDYLNLRVYFEADEEERDLKIEVGF